MFKILLALHLLFAIFAIGPLVHAATTASRGVRRVDAAAIASAARMLRIYAIASVLVVVFGFGALSSDLPGDKGQKPGEFGDTWVWLSLLLWAGSVAIVLALIVPALKKAAVGAAGPGAPGGLTARVAAGGGVVGVLFAVIVFLMVYRPGG